MGDIQTRPFSKNYSGLINQSVIAVSIAVICITSQEIMKRRRRGKYRQNPPDGLGSVESWEFGYLFQGRSWSVNPSPPAPASWPLKWIPESITFPEDKLLELRGIDATLYIRWLRACRYFVLLHIFTTLPILLPIHLDFSEGGISPRSMTRASISSLVLTTRGLSLLWIHICLLFWVTITWMGTLLWICHGAFYFRAKTIEAAALRAQSAILEKKDAQYHLHPHPQYPFRDIPSGLDDDNSSRGLQLRTIMVENIPLLLRSDKKLKEYFEYYMARRVDKPGVGLTSGVQPGFFNKSISFLFKRIKRIPAHLPAVLPVSQGVVAEDSKGNAEAMNSDGVPVIDRVVFARKMTELASLLARREDILRRLETAHIRLAKKALLAVKLAMDKREQAIAKHSHERSVSQYSMQHIGAVETMQAADVEQGEVSQEAVEDEKQLDLLVRTLSPYVDDFGLRENGAIVRTGKMAAATSKRALHKIHHPRHGGDEVEGDINTAPNIPTGASATPHHHGSGGHFSETIWEALLTLPRNYLDAYQPLVSLSKLFRGKTVPAIDYLTAKLNVLNSLITEQRSRAINDYEPVSTAFVTFKDPADARRACKYLAVHPSNPLACLVTMAPQYEDLDWVRVMKSSFSVEFVKDWVVDIGVWAFTLFWLFPVSLLVGLVSIQSIGQFWPGLKKYLDRHPWQEEVIQSFLPTLLVALLALLIPLILLLIAKKAHTISTLSVLHDKIMTRYYKFLVVNVLVFFCVGTAAVQTLLTSVKDVLSNGRILQITAESFPTAAPFYVGWLIFTSALHGGLELALLGLPLIMYPTTKRQVTPRKRAVGIRPRTFNFYYWLPNHMLVIHVLLLFSILNPLVIPFGFLYFCVEGVVVKNQLIHVYAKIYEQNGKVILIRLVRYSLDGLMLSQAVFLAYMAVLKKSANVGLAAFLIAFTAVVKIVMTRLCRAQYEDDDIAEANVVCRNLNRGNGTELQYGSNVDLTNGEAMRIDPRDDTATRLTQRFRTMKLPQWINFSYSSVPHRARHPKQRRPNPFGPQPQRSPFSRLGSLEGRPQTENQGPLAIGNMLSESLHVSPENEQPSPLSISVPTKSSRPVEKHPPTTAWNDNANMDTPYDNPYYTKTVGDILWLPRDPFGILDLDDTIDLRIALTSEPTAGHLGQLHPHHQAHPVDQPLPLLNSPLPLTAPPPVTGIPPSTSGIVDDRRSILVNLPDRKYSGKEEIELAPGIATRVADLGNEDDLETTFEHRPSFLSRRVSSSRSPSSKQDKDSLLEGSTIKRRPGRKNTLDSMRPAFQYASANSAEHSSQAASSYFSPNNASPPRGRYDSIAMHSPPKGAHPALLSTSTLAAMNISSSHLQTPTRADQGHARQITTQEAVLNEVLAEEQEAAEKRLKEEQAEADKANGKKSRLTSWIYKKIH